MEAFEVGHWGVRSDENDGAVDAIDAGFERVHHELYEELMDDHNPMTVDQIHAKLADPETLRAAIGALGEEFGPDLDAWDEIGRLAFAGVVVRHAELGVPIPEEARLRAIEWLENEAIDWEEATMRNLRRSSEIALLKRSGAGR